MSQTPRLGLTLIEEGQELTKKFIDWRKKVNSDNPEGSESDFQKLEQFAIEVDKTITFATTKANFPVTGDDKRLYVAEDTKKVYYWNGLNYVLITSNINVGTTPPSNEDGEDGDQYIYLQT